MKRLIALACVLCVFACSGYEDTKAPPSAPSPWKLNGTTIEPKNSSWSVAIGTTSLGIGYGMRWNSTADTYVLGTVQNGYFTPSPSLVSFPIQERMKRCVLSDAGVVQYYLCPSNSAQKADCATASVLDGTDGQVMVEIPKSRETGDIWIGSTGS